jgi:hypothetical protein
VSNQERGKGCKHLMPADLWPLDQAIVLDVGGIFVGVKCIALPPWHIPILIADIQPSVLAIVHFGRLCTFRRLLAWPRQATSHVWLVISLGLNDTVACRHSVPSIGSQSQGDP